MVQTVSAPRMNSITTPLAGRGPCIYPSMSRRMIPYFPGNADCKSDVDRQTPKARQSNARHGSIARASGGDRRHRTSTQLTSPSPSDIESDLFLRLRTTISSRTFPYVHPGARARERGFLLVSVRNKFPPGAGDVVRFMLMLQPYQYLMNMSSKTRLE